jgi:hypothetical protein
MSANFFVVGTTFYNIEHVVKITFNQEGTVQLMFSVPIDYTPYNQPPFQVEGWPPFQSGVCSLYALLLVGDAAERFRSWWESIGREKLCMR